MSLVNKAEPFLKFRVRLSHRPKLKRIFQSVTLRNLICECFQCVFVRKFQSFTRYSLKKIYPFLGKIFLL